MKLKSPGALRLGDTIALIRPASRLDEAAFRESVETIRNLGFCVALYPHRIKADRFFAASDADRAKELDWAFRQPGISAILCCRGGYGTMRAVAQLKSEQIRKWTPKIFVGYSDITYLHQWIQNRLGFKTIHGPLTGRMPVTALKKFIRELTQLSASAHSENWSEVVNVGSKKKAMGRLVGGNLSLIQTSGAAQLPKIPTILAIEDVNEDFYRLDRMLRALIDAGYSSSIKGIILGSLLKCGMNDSKTFGYSRILESLKLLTNGPIWTKARFGHGVKHQRLLPLGCQVKLEGKRFQILDSVVSLRT